MHVDLITLYLLAIGTLFVSSGLTLWEYRAHPKRGRELKILAAGYATLGLGCAAAVYRHALPGVLGSAFSNLVIVGGYLLLLHGVAALSRRQYGLVSLAVLVLLALTWAVVGTRWPVAMWDYVSAIPIAVVSGLTARELMRGDGMQGLQSRYLALGVAGLHAFTYAFRATALPALTHAYGHGVARVAAPLTMYEGVLYSVVLPMTLLRLVREEAHGKLLQESKTDYLTGLGNRRWFFEEGTRALRERQGAPVSLLAFDLDHFKTINDVHGHETGDRVLKAFGQIARDILGGDAIVARIGGEEFAALLPGHDGMRAREVGQAVVAALAAEAFRDAGGVLVRATVSIGLAQFGVEAHTLVELLSAADRALYGAKSLGGNRLELAKTSVRRVAA